MARVSIYYDKDMKEQFFMVRGDERYARSTKVILTEGTVSTSIYDFSIKLNVNVLRDVGKSAIVFYDNDAPVGMIEDWESTDNAREITISQLTYGAEHNFTAKYMGNNKCSPSLSNIVSKTVEDTNRATSTLALTSGAQYGINDPLSKTVTLTNSNQVSSYNVEQELEVWYDGTFVETLTTSDEGTATVSIPDVGAAGLHTLQVEYAGSEHLSAKTVTISLSVGYKVLAVEYPPVVVGTSNTYAFECKAKLTDYFDNPISSQSVSLIYNDGTSSVFTAGSANTDSNGIATISASTSHYPISWFAFFYQKNSKSYFSDNLDLACVNATSLSITASTPQLYRGEDTIISVQTNSNVANTPVSLTGDVAETLYTDSNGLATKTITGMGIGSKSIIATFGNLTQSISLEDYIQYWQPKNIHNQDYNYYLSPVANLNNLFRFSASSSSGDALQLPIEPNVDYELIITGLTTNKPAAFAFLQGNRSWKTSQLVMIDVPIVLTTHSNETWKIIREDNTVSVYKNNTLQNTFSNQGEYIPSFLTISESSFNTDFTKLTLRRI